MKKRFTLIILFLTFPSLVIGQSFGYKMVTIKTVPSGAELFLNGQSLGESPATVRVQDGLLAPKYMVRAELPGYKNQVFQLEQHWKPGVAIGSACCGMFCIPAFGFLIYAKEHAPEYIIYLQKID